MKPFLWRAKRGHSSSGGHNTPFHCGLALKFHRWWEERRTLDPPSSLRHTASDCGWGEERDADLECGDRRKAVGRKSREVTYLLFSNGIKHVFGAKVADETFRFHSIIGDKNQICFSNKPLIQTSGSEGWVKPLPVCSIDSNKGLQSVISQPYLFRRSRLGWQT